MSRIKKLNGHSLQQKATAQPDKMDELKKKLEKAAPAAPKGRAKQDAAKPAALNQQGTRIEAVEVAWLAARIERREREAVDEDLCYDMAVEEDAVRFPVEIVDIGVEAVAEDEQPFPVATIAPTGPVATALPYIAVPLKFITSALLASAKADVRYYLNGVYLHVVEGDLRICATDGHRMIVSSCSLGGQPVPSWGEAGIILGQSDLAQAIPILSKNATRGDFDHNEPSILVQHELGEPVAVLRSANGFARFELKPVDGKFPDYARVLASSAIVLAGGEGQALQVPAINPVYLRGAADVAIKLGAKAVHTFQSRERDGAFFFTFDGAPDTVLVVMSMRATGEAVSDGVAKIIGAEGIRLSISAIKAHVTRTVKALDSATSDKARAELLDRKAAFEARIAHLVNVTTAATKQIRAPHATA